MDDDDVREALVIDAGYFEWQVGVGGGDAPDLVFEPNVEADLAKRLSSSLSRLMSSGRQHDGTAMVTVYSERWPVSHIRCEYLVTALVICT